MSITTKPKVARAVHPNAGLRAKYQKQLLTLVDEMGASVEHWLTAAYRDNPPRVAALVAQDALSPSEKIQRQLRKLSRQWLKRFDEAAPRIAEAYLKGSFKGTDSAMMSALRDAGFAVKFEMTPAMRDAFQASLTENIGLIRSIPEQYLQKVEGIVARSYANGRDIQTMVKQIRRTYPKAADRAILIARDQSNKANAVVTRTRQLELGITDAIWLHSHGGETPRPSHVAANGRRYKIAEGCLIDGRFVNPGEEIHCRCVSRPVLPGL